MCGEVEVLMERMKQLQECRDDEEASQEEMATRFEREKTESMLVVTSEDEESAPPRDISRHFEDPSYGYKDFSRRGEQVPTFRAQVHIRCNTHDLWGENTVWSVLLLLTYFLYCFCRTTVGRTMASLWSTDSILTSDKCWTRSFTWSTTWPTTPWLHTRTWTPACCAGPSGTTYTACLASGQTLELFLTQCSGSSVASLLTPLLCLIQVWWLWLWRDQPAPGP